MCVYVPMSSNGIYALLETQKFVLGLASVHVCECISREHYPTMSTYNQCDRDSNRYCLKRVITVAFCVRAEKYSHISDCHAD